MDKCYCTKVGILGGQPIPHSHLKTDKISSPVRPDLPPIDEAIGGGLKPDFSTPRRTLKNLPPVESLDSILDRLRAGVDPDTKQPHITWDEAKSKLERLIQTSNRAMLIDMLVEVQVRLMKLGADSGKQRDTALIYVNKRLRTLDKDN